MKQKRKKEKRKSGYYSCFTPIRGGGELTVNGRDVASILYNTLYTPREENKSTTDRQRKRSEKK